jgi:hypothetical protein
VSFFNNNTSRIKITKTPEKRKTKDSQGQYYKAPEVLVGEPES